jgi:hypothetical protein
VDEHFSNGKTITVELLGSGLLAHPPIAGCHGIGDRHNISHVLASVFGALLEGSFPIEDCALVNGPASTVDITSYPAAVFAGLPHAW